MAWRISSVPELRECTPEARRLLVDRWKRSRPIANSTPLVIALIVVLSVPALCLSGVFLLPRHRDLPAGFFAIVLFLLWVAVASVIWELHLRVLRRSIRSFLTEEAGTGRDAICVKCGYDLRGSPSEKCPECGAPTRPKSRRE